MQVVNVFNGGTKTMQCTSHSHQNKKQDNAADSRTPVQANVFKGGIVLPF